MNGGADVAQVLDVRVARVGRTSRMPTLLEHPSQTSYGRTLAQARSSAGTEYLYGANGQCTLRKHTILQSVPLPPSQPHLAGLGTGVVQVLVPPTKLRQCNAFGRYS